MSEDQKRGQATQFFYIASLFVGALILISLLNFIFNIASGGPERVLAQDFGLSVMMIQSMPFDVSYNYDPDLEDYSVEIQEDNVKAVSSDSSYEYDIYNIDNVDVETGFFEEVVSIPMEYDGSSLTFQEVDTESLEQYCTDLRSNIEGSIDIFTKVESDVNTYETSEKIESRLETIGSAGNKVSIVDEAISADLIVDIDIVEGNNTLRTEFKEFRTVEKGTAYQKLVCFTNINMREYVSSYEERRNDNVETPIRYTLKVNESFDAETFTDNLVQTMGEVVDE